jgi:SAM-dependent methyltransferase
MYAMPLKHTMEINLFYRVYDLLYQDKDYAAEVLLVKQIAEQELGNKPRGILEIGCGTGNHTVQLAASKTPLIAIDTDPHMVKLCQKKFASLPYPHVQIKHTSVENLTQKNFDLVISLFNVVTYIDSFSALISFFKAIYHALINDGVFMFDAWNGIAAIREPPGEKHFHIETPDHAISAHLSSQTDFFRQRVTLTYEIQLQDLHSGVSENDSYSFGQSLWTPNQLFDALKIAGFSNYRVCALFAPEVIATEHHWKVMFICKK